MQPISFILRKAPLYMLLCAALPLSGCLLQSTAPVLFEKGKISALNVFSEKTPDISGAYIADTPQKKKSHLVVTRVENSENAFTMTDPSDKKFSAFVLVEALDGKNALLLQLSESGKKTNECILIPALLKKDGLTLFPQQMVDGRGISVWNDAVWRQLCKKYNVTYNNNDTIRQAAMTPDQYSRAVKAVFAEMFAAKALGPGMHLQNLAHVQAVERAAKEERERIPRFVESCAKITPQELKAALQKGFDANAQGSLEKTPLMSAVNNPDPQVCAILLAAGAKVDMRDRFGQTALMLAASANNPKILELLLQAGAEVAAKDFSNKTALHKLADGATGESAKDSFTLLLRAGADVNQCTQEGHSPLMDAVRATFDKKQRAAKLELAGLMLDAKANVNARDAQGRSALHFAGPEDAARLLLRAGADPNLRDKEGMTPLMRVCAYSERVETVRALLEAGADPGVKNALGKTALMLACADGGNAEIIRMLLPAGAEAKDKEGLAPAFASALHSAELANDRELMRLFLKAGASVNTRGSRGETLPMIEASTRQSPEFFIELLSYSPDLRIKDQFGQDVFSIVQGVHNMPLLFWLIPKLESPARLDLLLKAGVSLKERDKNGATASQFAAQKNAHPEILAALRAAEADPGAKDARGKSATTQAALERLPLDDNADFALFFKKYRELSKKEQLRYAALPFTVARLVDGKDEPVEKVAAYSKQQDVEKFAGKWNNIVPPEKQVKEKAFVRTGKGQRGEETMCRRWGEEESSCAITYTFKQINGAWRLIQMQLDESGI